MLATPRNTLELLHPRSLKHLSSHLQRLVQGRLWLKVLIGMALGIAVGTLLGPAVGIVRPALAADIGGWLALPGRLFLVLVQMIVIPLVFASIVRGLAATEDLDQLRRLGSRVVVFFLVTTAAAIVLGVGVTMLVRPGALIDASSMEAGVEAQALSAEGEVPATPGLAELPDKLVTLLPTNPLNSAVEGEMLQVVLFALVFGVALVLMDPTRSKPLLEVLGSLQEVCMTVVRVAMRLAPLAVFGLMAELTARTGPEALLGLAAYVGTVLGGLLLLGVMYLLIVALLARRSALGFLRDSREVLLLAFSTSSSAAVMPLSMRTAEEKLGVRPSISQFVIPIGATINMAGTALYQGVAAVFLAQVYGVDLTPGGILLLVLVAVGASIGSPATPGVGIVILAMVLGTIGVPASGVALILGVDRVLDMSRTALNVAGDLTATALMERMVGGREPHQAEAARDVAREASGEDVLVDAPAESGGQA
jgi:Na+/H+-dicarboxylate symporter